MTTNKIHRRAIFGFSSIAVSLGLAACSLFEANAPIRSECDETGATKITGFSNSYEVDNQSTLFSVNFISKDGKQHKYNAESPIPYGQWGKVFAENNEEEEIGLSNEFEFCRGANGNDRR